MAVCVAPVLDESLVSWVDRTGVAFGLTTGEVLRGLGLLVGGPQRISLYGVVLPGGDRVQLAAVSGLSSDRIGEMLLERFDGSALDLSALRRGVAPGAVAVREGAMFWGSRVCPGCLAESGGAWSLWWKLRLAVVCCRHRAVLVGRCPGCGVLPRRGRLQSGWPEIFSTVPSPTFCGHRVRGDGCRFDLAAIVSEQADRRLVAAQERVWDQVAAGDREWVTAAREAVALVRRFAQRDDLGEISDEAAVAFSAEADRRDTGASDRQPTPGFTTLPSSIAILAAVLPAAISVVDGDVPAMRWVVDAARATGKGWRSAPGRPGWSSVVAGRWRADVRPFLGFADIGRGCAAQSGIEARHIPQAAPKEAWHLIAPLVPGTLDASGRTFVALAAVVALDGSSWATAGACLDLPRREAVRLANTIVMRITERERFWESVAEMVASLAANPVDYRARRASLGQLTEVDRSSWRSICRSNGVGRGKPVRRRYAAGWTWVAVTGGLVRRSPAWAAAVGGGAHPKSLREGYRRFERSLAPGVAAELLSWHLPAAPEPTDPSSATGRP